MKTAKSWLLENILQSLITLTELNTELNADYSPPLSRLTFSYSLYKVHVSEMTNVTLIRLNLSLLRISVRIYVFLFSYAVRLIVENSFTSFLSLFVQIKLIFSLCLVQLLWVQTSLFDCWCCYSKDHCFKTIRLVELPQAD